jgi:hypothetical protein
MSHDTETLADKEACWEQYVSQQCATVATEQEYYDDYEDEYMWNEDCTYDEETVPVKVLVALRVLDLGNDIPSQVSTLAYDVIVNFLKEDTNV